MPGGALPLMGAAFGVVAILSLLMRRSSKGVRKFAEGKVTGIFGKKGHGKTIFGVHELRRHLSGSHPCRECSKTQGKRVRHLGHVASNGQLNFPDKWADRVHYVRSWEDLLWLPHCTLVMLDEFQNGWASADGGVFGELQKWIMTQLRKLHGEMIWISQDWANVCVGARRLTDEVGRCRKVEFRQMAVRFYDISGGVPALKDKPAWKYSYRVTDELAESYDTYELLPPVARSEREWTVAELDEFLTHRKAGTRPTQSAVPDSVSADVGSRASNALAVSLFNSVRSSSPAAAGNAFGLSTTSSAQSGKLTTT